MHARMQIALTNLIKAHREATYMLSPATEISDRWTVPQGRHDPYPPNQSCFIAFLSDIDTIENKGVYVT